MGVTVMVFGLLMLASRVSTQDLRKCEDVDNFLNTILGETKDCAAWFIGASLKTELQPFCDYFFLGLECFAMIYEPNNEDECLRKLVATVKRDYSRIFSEARTLLSAVGLSNEFRFADQFGQCAQINDSIKKIYLDLKSTPNQRDEFESIKCTKERDTESVTNFLKRAMKEYRQYANVNFKVKLMQGSIVGVIEISSSCATGCPIEITGIGYDILTDVNTGKFVVEAENQTFVASEGSLEIRTSPTPIDDDDDNTTTIIIVVVVVEAIFVIAIAVALYYYKKKCKSENKDIPVRMSDIQGKSNPGYDRA